MSRQLVAILLIAVSMVVVGTLTIMNGTPVAANVFGAQVSMTLGTGMLVAYLLASFAFGGAFFLVKREKVAQQEKLAEWNQQDQKLMQSVQSDRERQLEAKIQTLETALQQALKRKST